MKTMKRRLPGTRVLGSAMAVVMALGVASPVFAREHDRKAEQEQQDEGRAKARQAREDAKREFDSLQKRYLVLNGSMPGDD